MSKGGGKGHPTLASSSHGKQHMKLGIAVSVLACENEIFALLRSLPELNTILSTQALCVMPCYRDISITREGFDYFLVHEGRLLRLLGSCKSQKQGLDDIVCGVGEKQSIHIPAALPLQEKNTVSQEGLVDKLFFFLGDLEYATRKPKRTRVC
eukprot:c22604_g1_i2 orf=251-709(-)